MNLSSHAQGQSNSNLAEIDLKSVKENTKLLGKPFDQFSATDLPSQSDDAESQRSLQITPEDRTRDLRIRGIEQRIDILKDLIARQAAAEEARLAAEKTEKKKQQSQVNSNSPDSAESQTAKNLMSSGEKREFITGSSTSQPEQQNSILNSDTATTPSDSQQIDNHAQISTRDLSENVSMDWAGIPMTSSPINSLELANSLFRSGHFSQALKSYQDLLERNPDELDIAWLKLLAANCYRVLKDTSTAERLYREVTSMKEKSYAHDQARWYLNYLSQRKNMETQWQAIESEIFSYQPKK